MDTVEVYALNIQARDIVKRIKCNPDDLEAIDIERDNFKEFLRTFPYPIEAKFHNQIEAWEVYNRRETVISLLSEPNIPTHDFDELAWMNEIYKIFLDMIVIGNYDEFGGQQ